MAKKKKRWVHERLKLPKNHGWTAKPGNAIFIADRGDVRFDFPHSWIVEPGESGSIKLHDRKPPDDDCLLELSVIRMPPGVNLTGAPLKQFLMDAVLPADTRGITWCGEVYEVKRAGLEVVWSQGDFDDETQDNRAARTRWLLARRANILPFITMDFWVDQAEQFSPVWDEVVASLRVAEYNLPMTGPDPRRWPRMF
jgi:hypothetical protein